MPWFLSLLLFAAFLMGGATAQGMPTMSDTAKVVIPAAFKAFRKPARYKVAYGGRGSAKSESVARILLLRGLEKKRRVLCARELQTSIKDSVHQTLLDIASDYGLPYVEHRGELVAPNGTRFIYRGLRHNITEIKSLKGITDVWLEEAQVVSDESWEILIPTIREEDSEIWVTFNPDQETDPTYQRCVVNPDPNSVVIKVNWDQNKFFPEVLRAEKDRLYALDPEAAAWIWGGNVRKLSEAVIFSKNYRVEPFVVDRRWTGPMLGVDWGFANDPTVMIECYHDEDEHTLYVSHEAWGLHVENNELPDLFDQIPNARRHTSRADSARPETISHVKGMGYDNMVACKKGPGSVEDGIAWLKSQNIVFHPRCVHAVEEAALYSYKRDPRTGDITTTIVDKHNHCWDAIRYACQELIKGGEGEYAGSKSQGYTSRRSRRVT
jgi:phage terminase large subunit